MRCHAGVQQPSILLGTGGFDYSTRRQEKSYDLRCTYLHVGFGTKMMASSYLTFGDVKQWPTANNFHAAACTVPVHGARMSATTRLPAVAGVHAA